MRLFLAGHCALKRLEAPSLYDMRADELYELDEQAFEFLLKSVSEDGADPSDADAEFLSYCHDEGILVNDPSAAKRPESHQSPVPSLRYLELQITRRCNLRCRHCYIGPPEPAELEPQTIARILDEFEAMQGLRLIITGGEPLMHRKLGEINALLHNYALRNIVITNGTYTSDDFDIGSLNIHEFQVSLDGMRRGHDSLRGSGVYDKSMSFIERALALGFDVSVATMVHAGNLDEFDEMQETLGALKVKSWTVDVPCVEGNLRDYPEFQVGPEEAGPLLKYGWGVGLHGGGGEGYACGAHLMSVMADGTCARCAFYNEKMVGSISEGLGACWSRLKPTRLEELSCDCDKLEACRGGCRYRAELLGDPCGKDLYRCAAFGKLPEH